MHFIPEKLIEIRKKMGITKAEAARRLNMSAMGYGRYENGQRVPSYQTLSYIAQVFNTSVDYLCGETTDKHSDSITIMKSSSPELFDLIETMAMNEDFSKRIFEYYKKMK